MEKRIHKKMNIAETSFVLAGIICMIIAAMIHHSDSIYGLKIYQTILCFLGVIIEVTVISIELMFFHLETLKYKFITIGYYVLDVLLIMLLNSKIPFFGLVVLFLGSVLKNIYRVYKVEDVYKILGYYELCKKFGIKVKKPRKVKATVQEGATVKAPKRGTAKAGEPNYA